jgi:16S rRNA (guanine527-N7)-methyltransferase
MNNPNPFSADLNEMQLALNDSQLEQFELFCELLLSANENMNLTAITDYDDVYKKHFVDSLSLVTFFDTKLNESGGASQTHRAAGTIVIAPTENRLINAPLSVIDVGSGAGFPGLPLKIAFPQLRMTLIDSVQKKVAFLNKVISQLGLADTVALHGRAEDLARQAIHREQYDLGVSRAVAPLAILAEYCLPFVKQDGLFVAYKTDDLHEAMRTSPPTQISLSNELAEAESAIATLGGKIAQQTSFHLPNSDISRTLIGIKKITPTPDKYPRKAGVAKKQPL